MSKPWPKCACAGSCWAIDDIPILMNGKRAMSTLA